MLRILSPFRVEFLLLLLICCVITITSYRIDRRPFEDLKERAVTEWRFRRNFLVPLSGLYQNFDDHLVPNEADENGAATYGKRYIPDFLYDRMNK